MKQIAPIVLGWVLLFAWTPWPVVSADSEGIWQYDVETGLANARDLHKPVLFDFWASWCIPCVEMDRKFWTRQDVRLLTRKFVRIRVANDGLRSDHEVGDRWASKFGISAIPAMVITDSWANEILRWTGYEISLADEYLQILDAIPADLAAIDRPSASLSDRRDDISALTELAKFYQQTELFGISNNYLQRAAMVEEAQSDEALIGEITILMGWNHLMMGDWPTAIRYFDKALDKFPRVERRDVALFGLISAHLQRRNMKKARKYHQQLAEEYPDSEALRQAEALLSRYRD